MLVLLIGLAARLVPWSMTFTTQGVRFRSDTDPYYHALRAERAVAQWPRVPWTDPSMNFPYGARIPWPPLFDFTIAALSKVAGATAATPERVAQVAALLALAIGVALLPLVALLGQRLLGGGLWLDAALLVALLPGNIRFGAVGAADQHGAELLFSCAIFLAFVAGWRGTVGGMPLRRRLPPVAMGVLIAAAFWNWLGSALYLLILVAVTALWYAVAPAGDPTARAMARALLLGGLAAAALLAVWVLAFAPRGALGEGGLNGLTGLHVAMCGIVALFGALLGAVQGSRDVPGRLRRLVVAAAAALLSLVPAVAIPSLRHGVGHGLAAVSRGNAWYASISEYRPILFSGARTFLQDLRTMWCAFGLGLVAMPLTLLPMWRRWKENEEDRPALFFLFAWGSVFFVLTLTELRFQLYLVIPMALWICLALRGVAAKAASLWPAKAGVLTLAVPILGVIAVAAPALPYVWSGGYAVQMPGFEPDLIPATKWLRNARSADPSRPAVMGEWAIGHIVQYFAGKPVVVTPFGTDLDEGARAPSQQTGMTDWAAFLFATSEDEAEAVLARRNAGFVLLRSPKNEVLSAFGFAPKGTVPAAKLSSDWWGGPSPSVLPEFFRLVPSRLYYFDGMTQDERGPALGRFRLLYESSNSEWVGNLPPAHLYKVFGVVPGARIVLSGARPGAAVTAAARIQTNQNRVFEWKTQALSDAAGRATLRLPYATGANGLVRAGPYSLTDGVHGGTLDLDEKDVAGGRMEIDLSR
jgi:asparagine N-glycosylation enzyme membrane subunit Stt3